MKDKKEQELFDGFVRELKRLPSIRAPQGLAHEVIRTVGDREDYSRRFRWAVFARPALAIATSLLILASGTFYFIQKHQSVRLETKHMVRFEAEFADAKSIVIVGDFNKWDKQTNILRKGVNGKWFIELALSPGSYQYQFLVNDSTWAADPINPVKIEDGFGGYNSGIEI